MKIAVIKTGGKQYLVKEGSVIQIEKIKQPDGETEIIFPKVLLYADEKDLEIGQPVLENVKVIGQVSQKKKLKTVVWKYKPKTRYRKKKGYKKEVWLVRITKIEKELKS